MLRNGAVPDHRGSSRQTGLVLQSMLCAVLAGLVIIESSEASIVFRIVLETGYRLPVSVAVFAGAGLVGLLIWRLDGLHPLLRWFEPVPEGISSSAAEQSHGLVLVACLSVLGILAMHSFGHPIDHKLYDMFHEGEILGAWPILNNGADIPIIIHGPGRNLLPAALARLFAQPGHEIAFMRFVTEIGAMGTVVMAAAASYFLSFALLRDLAPPFRRHVIASMLSLVTATTIIFAANISNRHVLFLAALALAGGIIDAAGDNRRYAHVLSACLGAICAVAPIFVYSTGLETLAIAVIAAGILVVREGRSALGLIATALAGLTACFGAAIALGAGDLYVNATRDIFWWGVEAGGIWSHPLRGRAAIAITVLTVATLGLSGDLAWRKGRSGSRAERNQAALILLLIAAVAIATRSIWERSDVSHARFTLLTVAVCLGSIAALPALTLSRRWPRQMAACAISVAVLAGAVGVLGGDSLPRMVLRLNTPDESILPDDIGEFVQRYEAELDDADCLLVMTNEGVLNYAARLPPCGRFFYPIYGSVPEGDRALADWLRAHPQRIAAVETRFWSDNIDGKPMRDRMPGVWALIEDMMQSREEVGGRIVAVRQ